MTDRDPVMTRIQNDIDSNPVVLYMKGTPVFPQCGFSAQVVQVLSLVGVKFKAFDVLADERLRQASRSSATGRRCRSSTSRASSSAAATSCARCTRAASSASS
jgi:hypothetical protein